MDPPDSEAASHLAPTHANIGDVVARRSASGSHTELQCVVIQERATALKFRAPRSGQSVPRPARKFKPAHDQSPTAVARPRPPAPSIGAMFLAFFAALREARVPVTPREFLDLMRALGADLAEKSVEDFYRLSRALLVKDERNLDKFDVVFAEVFRAAGALAGGRADPDPGRMAAPGDRAHAEPRGARRARGARPRGADGEARRAPRRATRAASGRQ